MSDCVYCIPGVDNCHCNPVVKESLTTPKLTVSDPINHPQHYTAHPSGVECIQLTEHMNFCLGNALKYIWRANLKGNVIEDLKKARWYLDREIERKEKEY